MSDKKKNLNKHGLGTVAGGIYNEDDAVRYRCANPNCNNHRSTSNVGSIATNGNDGSRVCNLCGGNIEVVPHA